MLTKVCGVVMPGAGEADALQVGHHRVGVPLVDAATVRQYVSLETNNYCSYNHQLAVIDPMKVIQTL